MDHILVLVLFVTISLFFYFYFFDCKACGILARRSEIESAPPALEGKVSTTGPLRKSLNKAFKC